MMIGKGGFFCPRSGFLRAPAENTISFSRHSRMKVVPTAVVGASQTMAIGNDSFSFEDWEEEADDKVEGEDQGDASLHSQQNCPLVNLITRRLRSNFIEASHGDECGSLSPLNQLRKCLTVDGEARGRTRSPPKRSASPLRLREKGDLCYVPSGGGVADTTVICSDDDGMDSWRSGGIEYEENLVADMLRLPSDGELLDRMDGKNSSIAAQQCMCHIRWKRS